MRSDPESYRAAFVLARQKAVEDLLVTSTSPAQIANRLAELVRFDLSETYYDSLGRDIAALTLAQFHVFVARELEATKQVFGAFGNTGAIDAALGAAKAVP
jgi:predicted Zn-dependent peptidase